MMRAPRRSMIEALLVSFPRRSLMGHLSEVRVSRLHAHHAGAFDRWSGTIDRRDSIDAAVPARGEKECNAAGHVRADFRVQRLGLLSE